MQPYTFGHLAFVLTIRKLCFHWRSVWLKEFCAVKPPAIVQAYLP